MWSSKEFDRTCIFTYTQWHHLLAVKVNPTTSSIDRTIPWILSAGWTSVFIDNYLKYKLMILTERMRSDTCTVVHKWRQLFSPSLLFSLCCTATHCVSITITVIIDSHSMKEEERKRKLFFFIFSRKGRIKTWSNSLRFFSIRKT